MGSFTAQILVGEAHSNHDGLISGSIAQLFLSENSIPAWTLQPGSWASDPVVWTPEKPDSILEDGLLMVANFVVGNEALVALFGEHVPNGELTNLNLGEILSANTLAEMREHCRECAFDTPSRLKIVLCCFYGSSVLGQLDRIKSYRFDCEVLSPTFTRVYSRWRDDVQISGSLCQPE